MWWSLSISRVSESKCGRWWFFFIYYWGYPLWPSYPDMGVLAINCSHYISTIITIFCPHFGCKCKGISKLVGPVTKKMDSQSLRCQISWIVLHARNCSSLLIRFYDCTLQKSVIMFQPDKHNLLQSSQKFIEQLNQVRNKENAWII